jgi:hypothetical protein
MSRDCDTTTPAWSCHGVESSLHSRCGHRGFGNLQILIDSTAAGTERPDDHISHFHRHTAPENDHLLVIGAVYSKEWLPRLRHFCQILRRHVERAGGPGLVNGNIDAPQPSAIHADMRNQPAAGVNDGDVVRDAEILGLLFSRCDQTAGISQSE